MLSARSACATTAVVVLVLGATACITGEPLTAPSGATTSSAAAASTSSTVPAQITISPTGATLVVGGKTTITATVRNAVGVVLSNVNVTWGTENPAMATVSSAGVITGVAVGRTTITVSAKSLTGELPVTVQAAGAVTTTATASAAIASTAAQTVKGWGVYPTGGSGLYSLPAQQTAVYALGETFVRVQINPALYMGGTTVSDISLDPTTLTVLEQQLQEAAGHGVTSYIMSVWSPPASMKTNGSILGETDGTIGYLAVGSEAAFEAFLTKVVLSLQSAGLPLPMAISIQNEPDHLTTTYAGTLYPVAQWQRVIEATRASFDGNGLSTVTLFGPESGTYGAAIYYNPATGTPGYLGGSGYPAMADATLNHAVGAYAFHAYGECDLTQMAAGMQAYPRDAWITEWSEPNGTTELAWTIDMMRALAAHLVILPNNYWAWWNGWAGGTSAPDNQSLLSGEATPIYSKRYWALQALYTTVRPGWVVHHMTTTDATLQVGAGSQDPCAARVDLMAFASSDGSAMAVLLSNSTSSAKAINVTGLPGSTVTVRRSDASSDMAAEPSVAVTGGSAVIPLPANSVVLAVAR
jgi:O-glycosyl hydrolase